MRFRSAGLQQGGGVGTAKAEGRTGTHGTDQSFTETSVEDARFNVSKFLTKDYVSSKKEKANKNVSFQRKSVGY